VVPPLLAPAAEEQGQEADWVLVIGRNAHQVPKPSLGNVPGLTRYQSGCPADCLEARRSSSTGCLVVAMDSIDEIPGSVIVSGLMVVPDLAHWSWYFRVVAFEDHVPGRALCSRSQPLSHILIATDSCTLGAVP
jgi:hypothetical protein